ncbi:MAG TPA: LytTR family DNA-binding domain-containing protein [Candidatus Koribacter sp.]|jgi:two-component system LytT family response regulator
MTCVLVVSDDIEIRQNLVAMVMTADETLSPKGVDSHAAISEVHRAQPPLVMIQAELRSGNGLDLASEILRMHSTAIVVISRTRSDAARAFDIGVVDFVVAPPRPERIAKAARHALEHSVSSQSFASFTTQVQGRLRVKSKGGFVILNTEELIWVEAAGNYLNLHCIDRVYRVRETLVDFHLRIDNLKFIRIHRSMIVNSSYIRELRSWGMGDYVVVLRNSRELPVSRSYRDAIENWMNRAQSGLGRERSSDPAPGDPSLKSMSA